jgi:hypothetical protein
MRNLSLLAALDAKCNEFYIAGFCYSSLSSIGLTSDMQLSYVKSFHSS